MNVADAERVNSGVRTFATVVESKWAHAESIDFDSSAEVSRIQQVEEVVQEVWELNFRFASHTVHLAERLEVWAEAQVFDCYLEADQIVTDCVLLPILMYRTVE